MVRVVAALGGNALLRRGRELSAESQRENARAACKALAPVAAQHELVISHGNGPQVGLLASMGPKVRAACWFAERTGGFAAIGSIHDTQALLRGDAGTRVALDAVRTG
jgi:carbamate kinase